MNAHQADRVAWLHVPRTRYTAELRIGADWSKGFVLFLHATHYGNPWPGVRSAALGFELGTAGFRNVRHEIPV